MKLGNISQVNSAVYIKHIIQLNDRLNIHAGLRYDQFTFNYKDLIGQPEKSGEDARIFAPKVSAHYQASKKTLLFISAGKGFHSNDTRVSVQTKGKNILPPVYAADAGVTFKPVRSLLISSGLWFLHSDQEFVYVGDEGIVEPGGRSQRKGFDLSVRYQPFKWLYIDADGNYSHARAIDMHKGNNYIPLAPRETSTGGILYKNKSGFNGNIRYRYMGNRSANETNSVTAKGYFINDLILSMVKVKYTVDLAVMNLFDVRWKETQFETESRLKNERKPVSEIHFTPGTPFYFKTSFTYHF